MSLSCRVQTRWSHTRVDYVASNICVALPRGGECDSIRGAHRVEGAVRHGRAVQVDTIKTRVESAYGVCNQR
jgi:hypothetical protein